MCRRYTHTHKLILKKNFSGIVVAHTPLTHRAPGRQRQQGLCGWGLSTYVYIFSMKASSHTASLISNHTVSPIASFFLLQMNQIEANTPLFSFNYIYSFVFFALFCLLTNSAAFIFTPQTVLLTTKQAYYFFFFYFLLLVILCGFHIIHSNYLPNS